MAWQCQTNSLRERTRRGTAAARRNELAAPARPLRRVGSGACYLPQKQGRNDPFRSNFTPLWSQAQRQLLVHLQALRGRLLAAIPDAVPPCQRRHLRDDRPHVLGAEIGAPRVQQLVSLELVGEVLGQGAKEVFARPGPEV